MTDMIGAVVVVAFVAGGVAFLWAFVRFGIVSSRITKGAEERLRRPNSQGIAALTGVEPPAELLELYRNAAFIELSEFFLVDWSRDPPVDWPIYESIPLTLLDVRERLKISGRVPGIPIANDGMKGVYYISENGVIGLSSPNVSGGRIQVAPNVTAFANFEVRMDTLEEY